MIRIGTSSCADPEFVRDWYPPRLPSADRLSWYAEHFDYVEVNSTFYSVPPGRLLTGGIRRRLQIFFLTLSFMDCCLVTLKVTSLPPDLRRGVETNPRGNLILTPELERVLAERIFGRRAPARARQTRRFSPPTQPFIFTAQPQARRTRATRLAFSGRAPCHRAT